jgi:hypothetical protein
LPFWCDISIAYIAEDRVLGLSKFARIAHQFVHRLQLQERLTHQIADEVTRITQSDDVVVVGEGEHLYMRMRRIKSPARMVSSVVRGRFRDLPALRAVTLGLLGRPCHQRRPVGSSRPKALRNAVSPFLCILSSATGRRITSAGPFVSLALYLSTGCLLMFSRCGVAVRRGSVMSPGIWSVWNVSLSAARGRRA